MILCDENGIQWTPISIAEMFFYNKCCAQELKEWLLQHSQNVDSIQSFIDESLKVYERLVTTHHQTLHQKQSQQQQQHRPTQHQHQY